MEKVKEFTLRKKEYRVVLVPSQSRPEEWCWVAYRRTSWGAFKRIPMWTRTEEDRFPKAVAKIAHEFCQQHNGYVAYP